MPVPFLLRVEARDEQAAERLAAALRAALAPRLARCRVETAPLLEGAPRVRAGVWDAEGRARWLAPLPAEGEPEAAAGQVVAFLESWGFVARTAAATPVPGPAPAS